MGNFFLIGALLFSGLFYTACSNSPKSDNTSVKENSTSNTTVTDTEVDEIITDSVIDKNGVKLGLTFNNTKGTATLILNGESIEMKQDTMASGVQLSNDKYLYSEHQGNIELKKDGKIIFEVKD